MKNGNTECPQIVKNRFDFTSFFCNITELRIHKLGHQANPQCKIVVGSYPTNFTLFHF